MGKKRHRGGDWSMGE
uniref:Uncharacterized protein n=1 Tax=Arundo donax TaxID=35708 RepID=A0A0A9T6Q8_ARUDO